AAEPNKPFGIGVDAVLDLRPVVALPRPAPGLDKVSGLIELQHRRRRLAFLVCSYRARPLQDPRVAAVIDRHARYLAPDPLARQLGTVRIDLEWRDFPPGGTLGGRWVLRSVPRQHDDEGRECDDQRTRDRAHEVSSVSALIVCYRRRGVLLVPTSPVRLN